MSGHCVRRHSLLIAVFLFAGIFLLRAAYAQDMSDGSGSSSLGSVSGSLSDSSTTSGLDSSYNGNADSLGADLEGGVSDQGQSSLTGISVDGSVSSFAVSGYDVSAYTQDTSDKLAASESGGRSSGGDAAFSGLDPSRKVSGFGNPADRLAFSGGQTLAAMATEGSAAQSERRRFATEETTASVAVDPVLTPHLGGYGEANLQIGDTMPLPSAMLSSTFASAPYLQPQYQYDDGQTPLQSILPEPGTLLETKMVASASATGFPDSTLSQAGLPSEAQVFGPPAGLSSSYSAGAPFPSLENAFAPAYGLHPSLNGKPLLPPSRFRDFEAYEHYMFHQRILIGMDVSQAEWLRQADLETFERQRENTLNSGFGSLGQAPSGTPQTPVIH